MAKNEESHVRAVIRVGGGVRGQIAVGNEIVQNLERHDGGRTVTDADRADLLGLLDALRARVAAESLSEQRTGALERVDELTDALTTEEPEIGTVRYVLGWFRKKVPALAGAVRDLVLNPLVSRIVGAAGDVAAADFEQFLRDLPRI
jgi:hypothetical protein